MTVKQTLTIAELTALLDAAKAADAADKAATVTPYVVELLARKPVARSAKPEVLWIGTSDTVTVTVDGAQYRLSCTVTDVAATKALKAGK
jgi:hypothetical protein